VIVFSDSSDDADAHGAALTSITIPLGRTVGATSSGSSTETDLVVSTIDLVGSVSSDPTRSAGARRWQTHVHVAARSEPADGDYEHRKHARVGVLKVLRGGRDARFESVAPVSNVDAAGVERADVHAMTVRVIPEHDPLCEE
jgi:hypothetical protein